MSDALILDDEHLRIVEVCWPSSPRDCAIWFRRSSARPETEFNVAGRLRVFARRQVWLRSHQLSIVEPFNLFCGPIDGVVVEATHGSLRPINFWVLRIVLTRVALPVKVVGDAGVVATLDFYVDFV